MKKFIFSVVFGLFAALCLCLTGDPNVRAYAAGVTELGLRAEFVTNETAVPNGVQVGDIKVSVTITNNQGFATGGFRVIYSDKLVPFFDAAGKPVFTYGPASGRVSLNVSKNNEEHLLACAFNSESSSYDDGDIMSFYLKKKPGTTSIDLRTAFSLDVHEFMNFRGQEVPLPPEIHEYTTVWTAQTFTVMLGDIDGNGIVTAADAQLLRNLLADSGDLEVTLTALPNVDTSDQSGLYVTGVINGETVELLALGVADVNYDGIVDVADANLLLEYYVDMLGHSTPENPNIGTLQQITVWVYTIVEN